MVKQRKIVIGIIACITAVLFLAFAAAIFAPKIVDSKAVGHKLRSEVKKATGVDVDFKHLRLGLFPRPHVTIEQVETSISGARAAAASLTIHPRILPLFQGKLQITSLRLDSAQLDYTLPIKPVSKKTSRQPASLVDLDKKMRSFFSALPEFSIPNLDFQIVDSRVNLFDQERKLLTLKAVNSHVEGPPEGRTITIDGESNLWKHISAKALMNTRTFAGSGQIQMTQFQPQNLVAYLFPDDRFQVVEALADLTIDFKTESPGQVQATLLGSSPLVDVRYAKQVLDLKNTRIKAAFQIDKDATTLSLTELVVDDPQLNLSGSLIFTQSRPHLSLHAEGTHIDVTAIRRRALVLAGNHEVVKTIFDILRGGNLPQIKVKAQGNELSDLGNMDNMAIQGRIQGGEIHIPDINIDLKETTGEVAISRGVLAGNHLGARLGKATGQNGQLKLGLSKGAAPFHLETDVRADLSQLLPILDRLIDNKNVQERIAMIKDLKGSANGKLIIDKDRQGMKVNIDAADVTVEQADFCGISMSGTATGSSEVFAFGLDALATDQSLKTTLDCFEIDAIEADGTYRLKGRFKGRGKIENLLDATSGHVAFSVPAGGRIYHDLILLSVLKFFNTLERLDSQVNVADMGKKGFGYHSMRVKAKLQDGKLRYEEAVLRGQPMIISASGEHDIINGEIDMNLLVAPLVTVDRIFEHIPMIGGSLGTLDAIPLAARGASDNIHIYPLALSAIEHGLTETMKNSVDRPIKLLHASEAHKSVLQRR